MTVWGDEATALLRHARSEVLIAAPFVKAGALQRLLEAVPDGVAVRCVTRWEPREIAAGVSDLEVWPLLRARAGATLHLRPRLHGKLFCADERCLVGSANVTHAALGWTETANLELMVAADRAEPEVANFERELLRGVVEVGDELYEAMRAAVAVVPPSEVPASDQDPAVPLDGWLPSCTAPGRLYDAYRGHSASMLASAYEDATHDLGVLAPPPGLDRAAFDAWVQAALLRLPLVARIDEFAESPRTAEEMAQLLVTEAGEDHLPGSAAESWRILQGWLLTFFPDRFRERVPEGSGVFMRGRVIG